MSIYDAECLEDLLASHHRKWSQRVWTLQELLLAGDIVVVCGDKSISWDAFVRGLNYTQQMQQLDLSMDIRQTLSQSVYGWCLLLNLWFNFGRAGEWNGRKKRYSPSDFQRMFKKRFSWPKWLEVEKWDIWVAAFCMLSMVLCTAIIALPSRDRTQDPTEEKSNVTMVGPVTFNKWRPIIPFGSLFLYCLVLAIGRHSDNTRITSKNNKIYPYDGDSRKVRSSITQRIRTIDLFMQEVRQRIASDPKDKSYAMYGILRSFGASLSTPNYEKSLDGVFRELFSDLIAWNAGFIRLLMDAKTKRDPRLEHAPTWVPVFHDCSTSWLDIGYYNGTNRYSATSTDTKAMATVDGLLLRATIQRHGTVFSCSGVFSSTEGAEDLDLAPQLQRENISKLLLWFFHLRMRTPCTPAYESLSKAVLHVLEGQITIPPITIGFNEWYCTMMNLLADAREPTNFTARGFAHHAVEALKSDLVISRYFTNCCERLSSAKRNLFISSRGYIGSGPDSMVDGDVVVLVPGVPVPMVFRDAQEELSKYIVIGPACVQGLMKGEDWNEHLLEEVVLI